MSSRRSSVSFLLAIPAALAIAPSCGSKSGASIALPRLYPPIREMTPTALVTDPTYAATGVAVMAKKSGLESAGGGSATSGPDGSGAGGMSGSTQPGGAGAMAGAIDLAVAVQERLYTPGPTEILRIVSELDGRTAGLDTDPGSHPCLTSAPVPLTYALPGGQAFTVQLQCLQSFRDGSGWVAFGFDTALQTPAADTGGAGGASTVHVGDVTADAGAFYLVEGQPNGMGGAYRLDRTTSSVEGWISVGDKTVQSGSQVIMHLVTDHPNGLLELTFAGSGVGFCAAHLKTNPSNLFIEGKTNGAPAPGTPLPPNGQYCDADRSGCFALADLATDLGADDAACAPLSASTFTISPPLDASSDASANVTPSTVWTYFGNIPTGVPAF